MSEFTIGIREHKSFGFIASAYLIRKNNNGYYKIIEPVTSYVTENRQKEFSEVQKKAVAIINNYSDANIVRIFSRKSKPINFFKKLTQDTIDRSIKPFIERQLHQLFELLKQTDIKVFHKPDNYKTLYQENIITLHQNSAKTVLNINRLDSETRYFLSAKCDNQAISLTDKPYIVLSNAPCLIIIDNDWYKFDDVDAKKLLPFFDKTYITVPKSAEKTWYEAFALKAIKKYEVKAIGFIINKLETNKKAIVSLEKDWNGEYVFLLKFKYNDKVFLSKSTENNIVNFDIESFRFTKLERDFNWENEIIEYLSSHLERNNEENFVLRTKCKDTVCQHNKTITWLNENFNVFEDKSILLEQKLYEKQYFLQKINLNVNAVTHKDWFDIYGNVTFGKFEIPFIDLKNNILSNNSEFILPDNTIAIIPDEWFAKYENLFLFSEKKGKSLFLKKMHYKTLQDTKDDIAGIDKELYSSLDGVFSEKFNIAMPDDIRATLRPYQKEGFEWMYHMQKNNFGVCLADDMGLGKTLQTITLLKKTIDQKKENLKNEKAKPQVKKRNAQLSLFDDAIKNKIQKVIVKPSLVVAPVSLIYNWENEIMKFSPFLKVLKYRGQNRHKKINKFSKYDIILSGYATVRNDIDLLENYDFLYVVLDESQYIKNSESKTYKAMLRLESEFKLTLTGTPVENSLTDLWSQLNFLNNGILGSKKFFANNFIELIEKKNDENTKEKLKQLISPFILRRNKKDVAKDLPELIEQVVYTKMTDEQEKIYNSEKSKIRNKLLEQLETGEKSNNSILIIKSLTKLRQIANHPSLIDVNFSSESGKFKVVSEAVESIISGGHKVLIFSSFVKHLKLFADLFHEKEYKFSMLTGETKDREKEVADFQDNDNNKIFLISIKAGGTGLNLTEAEYVIILDPWWNPAVEKQAINRAHRIGQKKNVMVYRYISEKTIEEKIRAMQEIKQGISDSVIDSGNADIDFSYENIAQLLK